MRKYMLLMAVTLIVMMSVTLSSSFAQRVIVKPKPKCSKPITLFNTASSVVKMIRVTPYAGAKILSSQVPSGWTQITNYPSSVIWKPPVGSSGVPVGMPIPGKFNLILDQNISSQLVKIEWLGAKEQVLCSQILDLSCQLKVEDDSASIPIKFEKNLRQLIKFDSNLNLLRFKGEKAFRAVYNYVSDNESQWEGEKASIEEGKYLRSPLYDKFESFFPGYKSLNKKFTTLQSQMERRTPEPKEGYSFYEQFYDDDLNLFLNENKAFVIANKLYIFKDYNTLYEIPFEEKNLASIYQKVIRTKDLENLQLKNILVHDLKSGTIFVKDSNRSIEQPALIGSNRKISVKEKPKKGEPNTSCDRFGAVVDDGIDDISMEEAKAANDSDLYGLNVTQFNCSQFKLKASYFADACSPTFTYKLLDEVGNIIETGTPTATGGTVQGIFPSDPTLLIDGKWYQLIVEMDCGGETIESYPYNFFYQSPIADMNADPDSCNPLKYTFSPNVYINPQFGETDLNSYTWRVKDNMGNILWTINTDGSPITYTFPSVGQYSVEMTGATNFCLIGIISKTINVSTILKPDFTSDYSLCRNCNEGNPLVNVNVKFDASPTTGGSCPYKSYKWEWDDGTPDGTGKNPSHTFKKCGIYNVKLTVTDNNNQSQTTTKKVEIKGMELDFDTKICPNGRITLKANKPKVGKGKNRYPKWILPPGLDDTEYKTWNFLFPETPIYFLPQGDFDETIGMTYKEGDNTCTIQRNIKAKVECCAKNDRTIDVDYWGSDYKYRIVLRQTSLPFINRIVSKTKLMKKGPFNIYFLSIAKEIKAGIEGDVYFADGNFWEINVLRTKCNCVHKHQILYMENSVKNKPGVRQTAVMVSGNFATRKNSVHSYHYIKRKDGAEITLPALYLGQACDTNN